MFTSQLNSVGTEVSTGIYLTLWISLCFIDPSLLGFVAEIINPSRQFERSEVPQAVGPPSGGCKEGSEPI